MVSATDAPLFIGLDGTSHVQTTVDANGNIDSEANGDVVPLRNNAAGNPNCLTQIQETQTGYLSRTNPGTFQFADGPATVVGHLQMDFTYVQVIEAQVAGACDADLTYLAQCYVSGTGCTTDELTQAQTLFDLYVKQAHVLDMNQVLKIKALAYNAHFE